MLIPGLNVHMLNAHILHMFKVHILHAPLKAAKARSI